MHCQQHEQRAAVAARLHTRRLPLRSQTSAALGSLSAFQHIPVPFLARIGSRRGQTGSLLSGRCRCTCISLSGHTATGLLAKLQRVSHQHARWWCETRLGTVPAGSFRCDKFVRSSLASRMVGFIRGGSEASEPFCRASKATSTVFDYGRVRRGARETRTRKGRCSTSPF